METRLQKEENIQNLLDKVVKFNTSKRNEYYDLARHIHANYGIDHYVDLLSNLENFDLTIKNNEKAIGGFSNTDLVALEQELQFTAQILGLNASGSHLETGFIATNVNFPFSPFEFRNPFDALGHFLSENSRDPIIRLFGNVMSAMSGNQEANNRATALSREMGQAMAREMGSAAIRGMQVASELGPVLSMAAFASGNIVLGIAIGKTTSVINITLAYIEYRRTGDRRQFVLAITSKAAFILIGGQASNSMGQLAGLGKAEVMARIQPAIELLVSEVADKLHGMLDNIINEL